MFRVVLALLVASPCFAAEVVPNDEPLIERLVRQSAVAFAGVVMGQEVQEGPGHLVTQYTIAMTESLLGEGRDVHVVQLPGGRTPDVTVQAVGVPLWELGDEVVVFLRPDGVPSLRGLFRLEGSEVVGVSGHDAPSLPRDLADLRAQIEALRAR